MIAPASPAAYTLLYDAATDAAAARSAACVALGLAAAGALRALWRARRATRPVDGLTGFFAAGAVLFLLVAAASAYEQHALAAGRIPLRTVEGPIRGVWHDRTVRNGRTTAEWEGFRVADVPFVYDRGAESNYWRNRPWQGGPLGEGARVRIGYVERVEGGRLRRHIARVERVGE